MSIEFPNVITSGTDASAIKQQFSFLTCWLRNLSSYISYHVIALLERNFSFHQGYYIFTTSHSQQKKLGKT